MYASKNMRAFLILLEISPLAGSLSGRIARRHRWFIAAAHVSGASVPWRQHRVRYHSRDLGSTSNAGLAVAPTAADHGAPSRCRVANHVGRGFSPGR